MTGSRKKLHILGICGTLMGSLALLARQKGFIVSGQDQNVYPPMSTLLESEGIHIDEGYSQLTNEPDLVMVGNAGLRRGTPALEQVLSQGIEYLSGAEWLARFVLRDRWVLAVAGTHGKTTTASMLAWILDYAGLKPGFLIGGVPDNFAYPARLGSEPFFVVEADEYDTSFFDRRSKFLHYRPNTLVLNNLEYDHADIFPDLAAIQYQFHLLLRSVPQTGLIIRPESDQNLQKVINMGCWTPIEDLASSETSSGWLGLPTRDDHSRFEVSLDGKRITTVAWDLIGDHNMANGLGAIAAARHAGVRPELAAEALSSFSGVKRRLQVIYDDRNIRVYDDFAHHPTAISKTIGALRDSVHQDKIIAIIEPGSHTMKNGTHKAVLAGAVALADQSIWFKPDQLAWLMSDYLTADNMVICDSVEEIIKAAMAIVSNDRGMLHFLIMSNSGFGGLSQKLVSALSGISASKHERA